MPKNTVSIHISGPVGSGKSQLARLIANALTRQAVPVEFHDDGQRLALPLELPAPLKLPRDTQVLVKVKQFS